MLSKLSYSRVDLVLHFCLFFLSNLWDSLNERNQFFKLACRQKSHNAKKKSQSLTAVNLINAFQMTILQYVFCVFFSREQLIKEEGETDNNIVLLAFTQKCYCSAQTCS